VAAIVLSIPLALLGRAVLATPAAVARQTADRPADIRVGARHRSLADRAAWHLLAADRVEPFAEIVQTYRTVAELPALAGQPTWSVRVARLIPKLHDPKDRAEAYVMAGALLALAAGNGLGVPDGIGSAGARPLLAQALDDFRTAVRNDPESEEAKYDLELLLKQQAARSNPSDSGGTKRKTPVRPEPASGKRRQTPPVTQSRINDAGVYATGTGY
jgi:hypothetical protein